MRSTTSASWIIARFTGPTVAASIVGDLLETAVQRGTLWFWLSVARIAFSYVWRPAIAFVAAFYVGLFWRKFAIMGFMRAGHLPRELYAFAWWDPSDPLFSLMWFGTVLWTAALYAAIRYGLRDKLAQLGLGLCCTVAILVFCWRTPLVTVACIALGLCVVVASVRSAQRSKVLMLFTAVIVFAFAAGLLSLYLRVVLEGLFYQRLFPSESGQKTFNISFWAWAAWLTTTACARMHSRLLERDQSRT